MGNGFANLGRPDVQMRQAKDVISQLLSNGPTPQREIMDRLRTAGIGESTAKKAKQLMGVCSVKQGAMWFWALPDEDGR